MSDLMKPGTKADVTGEYELCNSDGTFTGMKVSMHAGDTLPATNSEGQGYRIANN